MNLHKILLLVWILVFVLGLMGLVFTEVSISRTAGTRIGPLELHPPGTRSLRIPGPLALGLLMVGSGMTIYTIFFRLK